MSSLTQYHVRKRSKLKETIMWLELAAALIFLSQASKGSLVYPELRLIKLYFLKISFVQEF